MLELLPESENVPHRRLGEKVSSAELTLPRRTTRCLPMIVRSNQGKMIAKTTTSELNFHLVQRCLSCGSRHVAIREDKRGAAARSRCDSEHRIDASQHAREEEHLAEARVDGECTKPPAKFGEALIRGQCADSGEKLESVRDGQRRGRVDCFREERSDALQLDACVDYER